MRSRGPVLVAAAALAAVLTLTAAPAASQQPPVPTPEQLRWSSAEVGCMISFGITASVGEQGCVEGAHLPPMPEEFDPWRLNTTAWVEAAASFGARYCVLVAQHSCGFSLWPSAVELRPGEPYNYTVAQSSPAWGRASVVDRFVADCERLGVRPGLYYTTVRNAYLDVNHGQVQNSTLRPPQRRVTQAEFDAVLLAQVKELWSLYEGRLFEVWFDGGYRSGLAANISAALDTYQPQAVAFGGLGVARSPVRWVGNEAGDAPVPNWSTGAASGGGSPSSGVWNPAEADTTTQLGDLWFYDAAAGYRNRSELVRVYHTTVGRNSNLLLNISPRPDGTLDPRAVAAYAALGGWVRECYGGRPVASASFAPGTRSAGATIAPAGGAAAVVDRVSVREDQRHGQLVRAYTVEALVGGEWRVLVAGGTSVGNRAIHLFVEPVVASALRLNVTASALQGPATAYLSEFAAYNCSRPE